MAEGDDEKKETFLLRWVDAVSEIAGYLSGICVFLATLIICYAVVLRAMGESTIWQTEMAVYLLMFVTFVGGAYGLKHGAHVNVDVFLNMLPRRARLGMEIVVGLFCLVLITAVAWKSYEMWWEATSQGWRSSTAWNPRLAYPYAIIPLGMLLIAVQYLAIIARAIRGVTRDDGGAA